MLQNEKAASGGNRRGDQIEGTAGKPYQSGRASRNQKRGVRARKKSPLTGQRAPVIDGRAVIKLIDAEIMWCGRSDDIYGKLPANVAIIKAGEPEGWAARLPFSDGARRSFWREYTHKQRLGRLVALMINMVRVYGLSMDEIHESFKGIDEYRRLYFSTSACKGSPDEVAAYDEGYRGWGGAE